MKRTISIIILLMSFVSNLWPQGYDSLWKKVNNAERDDQPRTQISILAQIQERAAQENAYGHLLASTLRRASLEYDISPRFPFQMGNGSGGKGKPSHQRAASVNLRRSSLPNLRRSPCSR